jgi:OPA family glycerol-3-phosphate transporter-like MFS transporter
VRARIFGLSWLSYFSYYFTRKNWSVVKSVVGDEYGLDKSALKNIDTVYLAAYAVGQFINGVLGDVFGPRRMLALGMLTSAGLAVLFGLSDLFAVFVLAYGLNGLAQSSGWPNNGRLMASWFGAEERGVVMGWWATCYQVGGIAAVLLASKLLALSGSWRVAYIGNAAWVAVVGLAVYIWIRDQPSDLGYQNPDAEEDEQEGGVRAGWKHVLGNPMVWCLGGNYFCMKLTRYSLLFWLPYYLNKQLEYDPVTAGYVSTSFEVGGVIGVVASGILADKVFGHRRVAVAATGVALLAAALGLYGQVADQGVVINFMAMMLVGALLFGPDALVSGAVAQDLGGRQAAALACGVVNGLGSFGAILQGFIVVGVSEAYGWDGLFVLFQLVAVVGALFLLPYFKVRPPHIED